MRRFILLFISACIWGSSALYADERKVGFYLQGAPPAAAGVGGVLDLTSSFALYWFEVGGGYDILPELSVEASISYATYTKFQDAVSLEAMGRVLYYPLGANPVAPFVFFALGTGTFQDEIDVGTPGQFLFGGGVGLSWFILPRHAAVLRISNIYHNTSSIQGSFDVIKASVLYRFTF